MKPDVDLVGRPDEFVRKPAPAAGAKDDSGFPKRCVNLPVPPTFVPEFHDVSSVRIELAHDEMKRGRL
jgi:hypothetical protein